MRFPMPNPRTVLPDLQEVIPCASPVLLASIILLLWPWGGGLGTLLPLPEARSKCLLCR